MHVPFTSASYINYMCHHAKNISIRIAILQDSITLFVTSLARGPDSTHQRKRRQLPHPSSNYTTYNSYLRNLTFNQLPTQPLHQSKFRTLCQLPHPGITSWNCYLNSSLSRTKHLRRSLKTQGYWCIVVGEGTG